MSKLKLAVVAATSLLMGQSSPVFGWGLVVPNGDEAHQYYQVVDGSLLRFDCPVGSVPTGTSCNLNKRPLGNYPKIRHSMGHELSHSIAKLQTAIDSEVRSLKERDPQVKSFREEVRGYATKVDEITALNLKTDRLIVSAKNNIALITDELKLIGDGLKREPSEEELSRLLERQRRYEALKNQYQTQLGELERELASGKAEKEKLTLAIQTTHTKLSEYMKALKVTSEELTKLEASKELYVVELDLLPELDARLTEKLAYELAEWDAPGAPELFARMMKHVEICK